MGPIDNFSLVTGPTKKKLSGYQPYIWTGTADRLRCCQLRWTVSQCGKLVTVMGHGLSLTVDICVQHGGREALRRAGLSAAAETCNSYHVSTVHKWLASMLFNPLYTGCRIKRRQWQCKRKYFDSSLYAFTCSAVSTSSPRRQPHVGFPGICRWRIGIILCVTRQQDGTFWAAVVLRNDRPV